MDRRKEARASGSCNQFEQTQKNAIAHIRKFAAQNSLSNRALARLVGLSEPTIRSFLNGAHKRGPHANTYRPLLKLRLGDDARNAILDFIEFEQRVLARAVIWDDNAERTRVELRVVKRAKEA